MSTLQIENEVNNVATDEVIVPVSAAVDPNRVEGATDEEQARLNDYKASESRVVELAAATLDPTASSGSEGSATGSVGILSPRARPRPSWAPCGRSRPKAERPASEVLGRSGACRTDVMLVNEPAA